MNAPGIDTQALALAVKDGVKEAYSQAALLAMLKEKPYLTECEVEILYGIPATSLKAWRGKKDKGPRFSQREKGGPVRYRHDAIKNFMDGGNAEQG